MKKLPLFLLLASPAFAQVYSQMAIQNTTGNWLKASPGALVYLCTSGTTNNNCLAKIGTVTLFTDQNMATTTANPITADANGNYTLFAVAGVYLQCVQAVTSFCQLIQIPGAANGVPLLFRTNSPLCTTLNQLVTYDTAHLDSNSVATVKNAAVSAANVIGVVVGGAGCSGVATIGTYLSALCVMDGAATVGDVVQPSASVAGFCHDEGATTSQPGVQTIGRVSKANSGGSGTTAQVDFFLGDLLSPGGPGGNAQITPCSTNGCNIYEPTANVPTITGDNSFTDNGTGTFTAVGGIFNGSGAGFIAQVQGTAPTQSLSNAVYLFPPTAVTTYGLSWPGTIPTNGDCVKFGVSGSVAQFLDAGAACGTTSTTFQVNAVNTTSQTTINFQNSFDMNFSNPSAGNIQVREAGDGQLSTPSAPVATVNGTPASTDYKYAVVGCQDINCVYHTPLSAVTDVPTGAATITSVNSITLKTYGDTFYGVRGFVICRTSSSGTPNTVGLLTGTAGSPLLAGKRFIDTGLAGDGTNCATQYATNTTITLPNCLGSSLPGVPSTPGFPCGVDGPPLSPKAIDAEFMNTFGAPGDANDGVLSWGGGGTSACTQGAASAVWSNGTLILTSDTTTQVNCLVWSNALPSTPFTFHVNVSNIAVSGGNAGNNTDCFVGLRESSTGKMTTFGITQTNKAQTNTSGYAWITKNWTTNSAFSNHQFEFGGGANGYFKIQDTGTNLNYSYSDSGNGVGYLTTFDTQTVTNAFTTAPNQIFVGGDGISGNAAVCIFDFTRQDQP